MDHLAMAADAVLFSSEYPLAKAEDVHGRISHDVDTGRI
jgi:hypothetical protein